MMPYSRPRGMKKEEKENETVDKSLSNGKENSSRPTTVMSDGSRGLRELKCNSSASYTNEVQTRYLMSKVPYKSMDNANSESSLIMMKKVASSEHVQQEGAKKHEEESIQVFVRVRPLNSMEKAKHSANILDCPGTREVVVKERNNSNVSKTFTFDRAFGPHSKQMEVYQIVVAPLLEKVIQGYNCTVFAYGQTGTGKTFTMEGGRSEMSVNWSEDPMAGIVPRALGQLFDELRQQEAEFSIKVSFLELYNEELYDLLAPVEGQKLKNLRLYEDANKKSSMTVSGLEEVIVQSKHEVYEIMEKGSERRKTASTLMNASSSRSHTVLSVIVHIKESLMEGEDVIKVGKLNLVDLAGSENIGRSGAVDKRAREAGNINQSLLTLGRVITALVERAPHVPYRESKLTRILKDSLGGSTKTSIIATVSPASINVEETLSTLEYAHRAKNITNQPIVNQRLTKHLALNHYTEEIERLRRDLAASREKNGVWVDKANFEAQEARLVSLQQELQSSSTYIKGLNENMEKLQEDVATKDAELVDAKEDNEALKQILKGLQERLASVEESLRQESLAKEEQAHLVERHVLTERNLQGEANVLMSTADEVTSNIERLWTKLERKRHIEQTNLEAGKRLKKEVADQLNYISGNIDDFRKEHAGFCAGQRMELGRFIDEQEKMAEEFQQKTEQNHMKLEDVCKQAGELLQAHTSALKNIQDGTQTEIRTKCEESLEILHTVIHKVARVDLANVLTNVLETRKGIQQLADSFKVHMTSQSSLFSQVMERNLKALDLVQKRVGAMEADQLKTSSALSASVGGQQVAMKEFSHAIHSKIKELSEGLNIIATQTKDYAAQFNDQFSTIAGSMQVSEDEMKAHCAKIKAATEKEKMKTQELHTSYENSVKDFSVEVDEKSAVVLTAMDQTSEKIREVSDDVEKLDRREEEIIEGTRQVLDSAQAHFTVTTQAFQENLEKIESDRARHLDFALNTFKEFKDGVVEKESDLINETREGLKEHCDQVYDWSEGQRSQVYQQAGKVREFWDSTYLVDQPTGATPHRQAYSYPKTLSATSPHDRIIGRFRAARRNDDDDEDRENF